MSKIAPCIAGLPRLAHGHPAHVHAELVVRGGVVGEYSPCLCLVEARAHICWSLSLATPGPARKIAKLRVSGFGSPAPRTVVVVIRHAPATCRKYPNTVEVRAHTCVRRACASVQGFSAFSIATWEHGRAGHGAPRSAVAAHRYARGRSDQTSHHGPRSVRPKWRCARATPVRARWTAYGPNLDHGGFVPKLVGLV